MPPYKKNHTNKSKKTDVLLLPTLRTNFESLAAATEPFQITSSHWVVPVPSGFGLHFNNLDPTHIQVWHSAAVTSHFSSSYSFLFELLPMVNKKLQQFFLRYPNYARSRSSFSFSSMSDRDMAQEQKNILSLQGLVLASLGLIKEKHARASLHNLDLRQKH